MERRRSPKCRRLGLDFPPQRWARSAWQEQVWEATDHLARPRTIWLLAGRGAGKDILASQCIFRDALRWYAKQVERQAAGGKRAEANPLVKVWVAAPQENNLKQTWDDWRGLLRGLAEEWAPAAGFEPSDSDWLFREVVRENKLIVFGRGHIEIEKRLTSTVNALRGPGTDLVHYTEAGMETVAGEFERAFVGELPGTINRSPRLGRVYLTSTPTDPMGGFFNELTKRFGEGVFQKVRNSQILNASGLDLYVHADSFQNEFLTPEQKEAIAAEKVNGWRYEREREGKWVQGDKGGEKAFKREHVLGCLVTTRPDRPGYRQIDVGLDIARFGEDETCLFGVDTDSGDIVLLEFHAKLSGAQVIDRILVTRQRFPGCHFRVDSTGHRGYVGDHAPAHLNIEETQFSRHKETVVGGFALLLEYGKLRIPDPDHAPWLTAEEREAFRKLIAQLLAFLKVETARGGLEFRHPSGEHDDGVDGAMLATMRMAARLQQTMGPKETEKKLGRLV